MAAIAASRSRYTARRRRPRTLRRSDSGPGLRPPPLARPGCRDPGRAIIEARPGYRAPGPPRLRPAPRWPYRHHRGASPGDLRARRRHPHPRAGRGARVWPSPHARRRSHVALCGHAASQRRGGHRMTPQPTWRYLLQMSRFAGGYSVAHAFLWGLMNFSSLLPGLIARSFFDALTGAAAMPVGTSRFILLLVVLALGQAALWLIAGYVEIMFRFLASALLRRNLLARLLDRPGALALPYAIGETINRVRDDVEVAEDSLDWTDEIIGQGVIAMIAIVIILSVDPGI